jgi:hypothetical protein
MPEFCDAEDVKLGENVFNIEWSHDNQVIAVKDLQYADYNR